jgi:hypothetical protein
MNILFEEFPELKEAFDLKEEFRKLYWSKRDKEELKDKMPAPEERNAFGGNRRGEPARMVRQCKEKQVAWHEDIHENHQGKRGGFAQLLRDFRNQRIG